MRANRTEEGQALVMIVFAVVAMFGFAALAVDLGNVFSERRRAQSAADASVFAVAWDATDAAVKKTVITEPSLQARALAKAKQNGFENLVGSNPALPLTQVLYYHPPLDGPYVGNAQYYQVKITTTVSQSFSQFIFTGSQRLTVEAVARARPVQSIFPGDAMHATNTTACKAVEFSGTGNSHVIGGNVFSNSNGVGNCASGQQNGSGQITVDNGQILTVGDFREVGSGTVDPNPTEGVTPKPMPDLPAPDCSGLTARNDNNKSLQPGIYAGGISIHNGIWTMAPGMYCLDDDFIVNGGSLTGSGVLIVQRNGDIDFAGNAVINLTRPTDLVDAAGQHWGGMLIFMPANNDGGIDLSGGSGTNYTGTVFAPGPRSASKSKCTVGGNSDFSLTANIICNTIQVHGTGNVSITYKQDQNYRMPPIIELAQ